MKVNELDDVMSEILVKETKKLIKEQLAQGEVSPADVDDSMYIDGEQDTVNNENTVDLVKSFQSLSGLVDKITEVEDASGEIIIQVQNVTPEELVDCCGGSSLQEALKNLMQGIHHDLEDNRISQDLDVDIDTQGDENGLHLTIRIETNKDKTLGTMEEMDMNEVMDNGELTNTFGQAMYEDEPTNPEVDDEKDVILGSKEIAADEQWQAAAGEAIAGEVLSGAELPAVVNRVATSALGGKIADALGGNNEEINERKKITKTMAKNESTQKKTIRLNESEMELLITNIINEAVAPSGVGNVNINPSNVLPGGVPGLDVTKVAQKMSGEENDAALKAVEKKIKDYLSFDGNDNPEFPKAIGKGEKVARENSSEEDDVVADNRGGTMANLTYDQEPAPEFRKREKMSLVGASQMGNPADAGNAIKTDLGDKMVKQAQRLRDIKEKEPLYNKEAVPVETTPKTDPKRPVQSPVVEKDIARMKQMSKYNKKTQ